MILYIITNTSVKHLHQIGAYSSYDDDSLLTQILDAIDHLLISYSKYMSDNLHSNLNDSQITIATGLFDLFHVSSASLHKNMHLSQSSIEVHQLFHKYLKG